MTYIWTDHPRDGKVTGLCTRKVDIPLKSNVIITRIKLPNHPPTHDYLQKLCFCNHHACFFATLRMHIKFICTITHIYLQLCNLDVFTRTEACLDINLLLQNLLYQNNNRDVEHNDTHEYDISLTDKPYTRAQPKRGHTLK